MILLHPLSVPQPNPPPNKPLLPLQQKSNMIMIRMHEDPLSLLSLHLSPQCVAAKSLMYEPPKCFYIV